MKRIVEVRPICISSGCAKNTKFVFRESKKDELTTLPKVIKSFVFKRLNAHHIPSIGQKKIRPIRDWTREITLENLAHPLIYHVFRRQRTQCLLALSYFSIEVIQMKMMINFIVGCFQDFPRCRRGARSIERNFGSISSFSLFYVIGSFIHSQIGFLSKIFIFFSL